MDRSAAYRKGLRDHLPEAKVTFDRFHVVKLLNDAADLVRRAEQKEAPELSRTRFLRTWCRWARDSELEPMARFARTVEVHREGMEQPLQR